MASEPTRNGKIELGRLSDTKYSSINASYRYKNIFYNLNFDNSRNSNLLFEVGKEIQRDQNSKITTKFGIVRNFLKGQAFKSAVQFDQDSFKTELNCFINFHKLKPSIILNTEYVKDFEKEKKKGENPLFSTAYMKNKLFINLEKPADYLTILD